MHALILAFPPPFSLIISFFPTENFSLLLLLQIELVKFRASIMDRRSRKKRAGTGTESSCFEEVSSKAWEMVDMTEQEEDLIYRMYNLVGDRWSLIAGRIPGRKPEEIERFWIMRHSQVSTTRPKPLKRRS